MGLFRKPRAGGFVAAGRPVACPHCQGQQFRQGTSWWDGPINRGRTVDLLSCTACGRQVGFDAGSIHPAD